MGNTVKFIWSTSNATQVSLGSYNQQSDTSETIYSGLVPNGSTSLVIPLDIDLLKVKQPEIVLYSYRIKYKSFIY